jgi:deoxyhypusine monooxygenase
MDAITSTVYQNLHDQLNNVSGKVSLQERFRALFTLRALGTNQAVDIIAACFSDPSALLKHECAYVLGQIGNRHACSVLEGILRDESQDPMVRHEAGEALGAIGDPSSMDILLKFSNDSNRVISETCQLSIERIRALLNSEHPDHAALKDNRIRVDALQEPFDSDQGHSESPIIPFASIDPTPAETTIGTIEELTNRLIDPKSSLYDRYKAMFALRNINSSESALALAKGFEYEHTSALFRHEIAYVLGQMQQASVVDALAKVLALGSAELPMVRHECAEALGAIATPEANTILSKYLDDKDDVVRESCIVALDILDYEQDPSAFQYADGLLKMKDMKERPITSFSH